MHTEYPLGLTTCWKQAILHEKRIQNSDSEDDLGSQKKNREDSRNIYQRTRRSKEQMDLNNSLERINSRIAEAKEWITDLENRIVEITATKLKIEKKNNEKEWK